MSRAQLSVQEVVLRVAYAELEGVGLDVDVFDLKHRRAVLACADEGNSALDENKR